MAAGSLPAPGTKLGPCLPPCTHTDCLANRAIAVSRCRICQALIDYETLFYVESGQFTKQVYVHATCLYDEIDAEMQARKGKVTA
jgi:hypothetical protein